MPNREYSFLNTSVLSVSAEEAPIAVTSADIDNELQATYDRTGLRPGLLEGLAGIRTRRWWEPGTSYADAAAAAGRKAIAAAGINPGDIGFLVNTSVCRDYIEPSLSVDVHHQLELSSACLNFDLANACLGFINGIHVAGLMLDAGQIDYALIVDGEGSRRLQETTLAKLTREDATAEDVFNNFASLTLGSGAAAMVLTRTDLHQGDEKAHQLIAGVSWAATQHNKLCVGTIDSMTTDSRALLEAGTIASKETWTDALALHPHWNDLDTYIIHQVSQVHTDTITSTLGIDPSRVPLIFPDYGNLGPASIPYALALHQGELTKGDQVGFLGIGSGINTTAMEMTW